MIYPWKKRRNRMSQTEPNIWSKNSESILKLLELNNDTWYSKSENQKSKTWFSKNETKKRRFQNFRIDPKT